MRALIDASGWPEALAHYRMFPYERSASANLDFHIDQIVPLEGISLEKILDDMNQAADDDENEILIVSHGIVAEGSTGGLTMPLAAGCEVDAMRDELQILTEAAVAISAGQKQEPAWLRARADSLGLSLERLLELCAKRNQIASRQFRRVEIRACNLGAFPGAMQVFREFFGSDCVLASEVPVLCGGLQVHILEDPNQYQEWIQSRGGLGSRGSFGQAFCLRIQESSLHSNTFELEAAARNEDAVQSWVEDCVMPGAGCSGHGALQISALWTFGRPGLPQPYVLPGESEYRSLIASASP